MTVWEPDGNAPDGRRPFGGTTVSLFENDKFVGLVLCNFRGSGRGLINVFGAVL